MTILIIGGGASGMMAALTAGQNPNCQVILLERQSRLGKKLSATGNGRCNLSNRNTHPDHFFSGDSRFPEAVLNQFSPEDTLDFFAAIGLATVTEPGGKIYPFSDQASSVVDVLRLALQRQNIQVVLDCDVTKIWKKQGGFLLKTSCGDFSGEKLILAAGGVAGEKLGGTDAGYGLAKALKHKSTPLYPSLVQLVCREPAPGLKGIRTQCGVAVTGDNGVLVTTAGEVQFTQLGLSGPAIFEVSRWASVAKNVAVHLDLLPIWSLEQGIDALGKKCANLPNLRAEFLLTGILHQKLGVFLLHMSKIPLEKPLGTLTDFQLEYLVKIAKDLPWVIGETMGFDSCQVTAGGLETQDFSSQTLKSRLVPNFFACGEVLDVDGNCGGFNLQWAWSSGFVAGKNATKGALHD